MERLDPDRATGYLNRDAALMDIAAPLRLRQRGRAPLGNCCRREVVRRRVDDGEDVRLLGARGDVAGPQVKLELAPATCEVRGDVEGNDCGGFVCGVAVFHDEELVLGVFFEVAGLDPVAECAVRVDGAV